MNRQLDDLRIQVNFRIHTEAIVEGLTFTTREAVDSAAQCLAIALP